MSGCPILKTYPYIIYKTLIVHGKITHGKNPIENPVAYFYRITLW